MSWDPSAVGKQAWVRSGGSSILVTSEQLRCAFGFEQWGPSSEDVMALKNASEDFSKYMLDDRGPPPQDPRLDDPHGAFDETQYDDLFPSTPSMMVPATPPELLQPQPSTPPTFHLSTSTSNSSYNKHATTVFKLTAQHTLHKTFCSSNSRTNTTNVLETFQNDHDIDHARLHPNGLATIKHSQS